MPLILVLFFLAALVIIIGIINKNKITIFVGIMIVVLIIIWGVMFIFHNRSSFNQESPDSAYSSIPTSPTPIPLQSPSPSTQIANPASTNCLDQGGQLTIKQKPKGGGEYGICVFEDNYQCEEWALLRGECSLPGRKITGYDTDAQIYCAITGGEVNMDANTCTKEDDMVWDLDEYFSEK